MMIKILLFLNILYNMIPSLLGRSPEECEAEIIIIFLGGGNVFVDKGGARSSAGQLAAMGQVRPARPWAPPTTRLFQPNEETVIVEDINECGAMT